MNRRSFTQLFLFSALMSTLNACRSTAIPTLKNTAETPENRQKHANELSEKSHQAFLQSGDDFKMLGNEQIVMLMYPGFAALDLIAPHYLFTSMMGAKVLLISSNNDLKPVKTGEGLEITPTHTQTDCPKTPDILFVPGGATGTLQVMQNSEFINFIRETALHSKYVTSVCTGSLLLGKAGLLKGKKATSHWVTLELLPLLGAIPVKQRVVWDGNIVTGGGVTAGIDFGLEMLAQLRGKQYAKAIQLQAEYNPMPPFDSGSPETTEPFITENIMGIFAPLVEKLRTELTKTST